MDTQNQHTVHRLSPGFSIIHANHLEDLRQVAVGWIKVHPLQVLETLHIETLLHLPDSRMGVSEVMDLLDVAAFRKRFKIDSTDLPKLRQWIEGTGISWGLNGAHRAFFGLPGGLEKNTWAFGLDRMLLGYAVGKGVQ